MKLFVAWLIGIHLIGFSQLAYAVSTKEEVMERWTGEAADGQNSLEQSCGIKIPIEVNPDALAPFMKVGDSISAGSSCKDVVWGITDNCTSEGGKAIVKNSIKKIVCGWSKSDKEIRFEINKGGTLMAYFGPHSDYIHDAAKTFIEDKLGIRRLETFERWKGEVRDGETSLQDSCDLKVPVELKEDTIEPFMKVGDTVSAGSTCKDVIWGITDLCGVAGTKNLVKTKIKKIVCAWSKKKAETRFEFSNGVYTAYFDVHSTYVHDASKTFLGAKLKK